MLNTPSEYLVRCVEAETKRLRQRISEDQKSLNLLEVDFPDGYLTTVCMDDEPLVLFVGDKVFTKYGDILTIKSFDVPNGMIEFEEHEPLGDHRISHVVSRTRKGFEISRE
jgi:hypothetical protein